MKSSKRQLTVSKESLYDVLSQPSIYVSEFLTGLLSSQRSDLIFSAGKIAQGMAKGQLLIQLGRELKMYQEKGKIKEDYLATNKSRVSLLELLQFVDGDIPDEEIFRALKAIFFCSISTDSDSKDEEICYQLLLICKKLSSFEILILKACYEIYASDKNTDINTDSHDFGEWMTTVSSRIGYDMPELVSASDDRLVELGLLSGRSYSDKSGIRPGKEYRLTKLSIKMIERIARWESKK